MACSCKNKKVNSVYIPAIKSSMQVNNIPSSHVLVLSLSLTFTSITKPDLLCINCIYKHLSFALVLLLYDTLLNRCIAAGLLMCAADHILQTNKLISVFFRCISNQIVTSNTILNICTTLKNILLDTQFFNKLPVYDKGIYTIPYKYFQVLCQSYSLLFTLISYLLVNKKYAIGRLTFAASFIVNFNRDIALHIRLIWKMIQDMTPYDLLYKKARKLLLQVILLVKHIVDLMSDSKSNTQETV